MVTEHQLLVSLRTVTKTCILTFVALVTVLIVVTSFAYFPPQFSFGFLLGRESYFYSWYAVAFYTHVISAPIALFLGLFQSIHWLRNRSPRLHRTIGYVYVLIVLVFAAPSGLAMSLKAKGGYVSIAGFALLAVSTAATTYRGFSQAKRGDFLKHRQWMTRSFLLLSSAVQLRFIAAVCAALGLDFVTYGAMAWLCWLPSLLVYEGIKKTENPGMPRQSI